MNIIIFIFLITRTQPYFFDDQFIQNETYIAENQLQQSDKTSLISNKILVIIVGCLAVVVIATLLTVYLIKDQIKDFTTRVDPRSSVIHHFHPEVLLRPSIREQISSHKSTVNEVDQQERISSSNQHQQSSRTTHRQS